MGKFKVGDRVRLTKDNYGFGREGDEVTIIKIDDGSAYCRFDYLIENDFDWFVPLSSLVAAAPQQQPLTVRAGRYYKTRDGRKVGPAEVSDDYEYPWRASGALYLDNGRWLSGDYEDDNDLIADIVRRLEALEGATNDTHVRIGDKVTLRATVTGKQKKTRINITLDDVSGASHSLVVPATALTLAA